MNLSPKVLWTNSNSTLEFGATSIQLPNLAEYDFYEIVYRFFHTNYYFKSSGKIPKGLGAFLEVSYNYNLSRFVSNGGTYLSFDDTKQWNSYGGSSATNNNKFAIPHMIIGYKKLD